MRCHYCFILYSILENPPENAFISLLPKYKPMEFNMHFLLSKNTKSTSRGNKSKSDPYLSVFVFIFLCVYIYIYNPMITPPNLCRRFSCLSDIGRR